MPRSFLVLWAFTLSLLYVSNLCSETTIQCAHYAWRCALRLWLSAICSKCFHFIINILKSFKCFNIFLEIYKFGFFWFQSCSLIGLLFIVFNFCRNELLIFHITKIHKVLNISTTYLKLLKILLVCGHLISCYPSSLCLLTF